MAVKIIDTFKDFEKCFKDKLDVPIGHKIDLWEKCYISKYPELENKCKEDYENSGYRWRDIANTMVFNRTKNDFSKMKEAYSNLLSILSDICEKAEKAFELTIDINVVLYAGLCNSAGWVDFYDGKRAVLFGIDKIAELDWHTLEKLGPLAAHELCHVIHFQLRGEDNLPDGVERNNNNKGIWRIYEEGFAQYYQNKLLLNEIDSRGKEWTLSCNENKEELKKQYLEALQDNNTGVRHFFGDWFQVLGISDAGYFLGSELINRLHGKYGIELVAKLPFSFIKDEVLAFLLDGGNSLLQ
jgi:hypothetical protein